MFIPHENSHVKSIRLSQRGLIGAVTAAIGTLALLVGLGLHVSGGDSGDGATSAENQRLRSELQAMEGQIATLDQRLESLQEREEELRIVADLPPVPVEIQAVGVGGPGHRLDSPALGVGGPIDRALEHRVDSASTSLDLLLRRSSLVASGMNDVRASIAAKKAKFEATPSIWPASGFLSSTFSHNRRHPIFHDVRPHYGIDISARRGGPIVATAAGRVTSAGWENGHGNYVEVDHGHGVRTTYSHASRILVRAGEQVTRGQTIALIGSTGFSVAPHVHYEVHENGQAVDPLKYIFPDAIAD